MDVLEHANFAQKSLDNYKYENKEIKFSIRVNFRTNDDVDEKKAFSGFTGPESLKMDEFWCVKPLRAEAHTKNDKKLKIGEFKEKPES